jgi:hypothetical protein
MTRLYVDKQEVEPLPPDLSSLDQVLKLVQSTRLSPNTVIRQVQVDGVPLISDDRNSSIPERIDDREKIEIFTGTLQEVALDSIREAITYLERVETATPSLASSFRAGSGPEVFENLKQFYEGFYWVNLLLDRLQQTFHVPLDTISIGDSDAREHNAKLAAALKEIVEAHEKKDFGLVADLLEYEVAPIIPGCKDVFTALRDRILAGE